MRDVYVTCGENSEENNTETDMETDTENNTETDTENNTETTSEPNTEINTETNQVNNAENTVDKTDTNVNDANASYSPKTGDRSHLAQHDVAELNRRKMIVLIPFQLLKLRSLIHQIIPSGQEEIPPLTAEDIARINQLQEKLRNDIIGSIEANIQFGNITMDDAKQLLELTELPNDKYRFRIDELEKQLAEYAEENARYADENAKYADEITKYADENTKLRERIKELEQQK